MSFVGIHNYKNVKKILVRMRIQIRICLIFVWHKNVNVESTHTKMCVSLRKRKGIILIKKIFNFQKTFSDLILKFDAIKVCFF